LTSGAAAQFLAAVINQPRVDVERPFLY